MPQAKNKSTDLIIGTALITAETIAQELRERLAVQVAKHRGYYSQWELLDLARGILSEFEPLLAENLMNSDLAAWISGFDRVASKTPKSALEILAGRFGSPPSQPPRIIFPSLGGDEEPIIRFPLIEEAAQSLLERRIVTPEEFAALADDMKRQAFTVAGESSRETLETIRDVLAEDVAEGASLKGFRDKLRERIDTSGYGPGQLEKIYRTNVQAAFSDGHETLASNPIVQELFPYQEYLPIHDGRVDPQHLAMGSLGLDGTGVYRRDDPVWDYFTPPWRFNCRCGVNLLSVEAAARKGVKEAQRWLRTGRPPVQPEWRIDAIPFRPKPGFGGRRKVAA